MSQNNRSLVRKPSKRRRIVLDRLTPEDAYRLRTCSRVADDRPGDAEHQRFILSAAIESHREQLVATARHYLRNDRCDAEDIVQQLCEDALSGAMSLSDDPSDALASLERRLISRCRGGER